MRGSWSSALLLIATLVVFVPVARAAGVTPAGTGTPTIHVSRHDAGRLDAVTFSGTGFTAGDLAAVFVTFNTPGSTQRVTATSVVAPGGAITGSFIVPYPALPGTYQVTARDFHARTATTTLVVLPVLLLVPGRSPSSVNVTVTHYFYARANGFAPDELVQLSASYSLYTGNNLVVHKVRRADAHGSFGDLALQVPVDTRPGIVTLIAVGEASKRSSSGRVRVGYVPTIGAGAGTVRPGGSLTLTGHGFVPSSTVHLSIAITENGVAERLGADVSTDAGGSFAASVGIPIGVATNTYTVVATDGTGGFRASTRFNVAVGAELSVSSGEVKAGETFRVTGAGFVPNTTIRVLAEFGLTSGGSRAVEATVTANKLGGFTVPLSVPATAIPGIVTVLASSSTRSAHATVAVRTLKATIVVSPPAAIPGATVTVKGSGFSPGDRVALTIPFRTTGGRSDIVTQTALAGPAGAINAQFRVPPTAASGIYTVAVKSAAIGAIPGVHLAVVALSPSIVALPTAARPGTAVEVRGFGFAAGITVGLTLNGQTVGTATTDSAGQCTASITIPAATAAGSFPLTARAANGEQASIGLEVVRLVSDHFYISSIYTGTGYHEYITLLNPTATRSQVTITYERKDGTTLVRSLAVNPHSRLTENVNTDLGSKISAAAVVGADAPIEVERVVYHGTDGDVVPAARAPATTWYFASGNTAPHYREYIALQNPGRTAVQVAIRFLPAHNSPFTIYRTVAPTSRLTVKVNTFVPHDAVGAVLSGNGPFVANRTMFVYAGMTSTDGVVTPQRDWYFASGPEDAAARHWIGLINQGVRRSYVTVHAYGPLGTELGTASGWVRPGARVGYLLNRIAGRADVAVLVTGSEPVVAEQSTYVGARHESSTDTFGTSLPQKSWSFPTANTSTAAGEGDILELFNPNLVPIPVAVDFITTNGATTVRTFIVGPLNHQHIDVAAILPNAQLGLVAASNYPFAALNRGSFNSGAGGFTDSGIH